MNQIKLKSFMFSCLGFLFMLGAFNIGDIIHEYDMSNLGYDRITSQSWYKHSSFYRLNGEAMTITQLEVGIGFNGAFILLLMIAMIKTIPLSYLEEKRNV